MQENMLRFRLEGMTCSACSSRIERVLNKVPYLQSATVSLAANIATVVLADNYAEYMQENPIEGLELTAQQKVHDFDFSTKDIESYFAKVINERVAALGFKAELIKAETSMREIWEEEQIRIDNQLNKQKQGLILEALFSIPIIFIAMGSHMGLTMPSIIDMHTNPLNFALIQAFLLIPVLWFGRGFYTRGFPNLFRGAPNMDSLVAIGTGAAVIFSLWSTFEIWNASTPEEVHQGLMGIYYESCAMLITLISFGKYLEQRLKSKTRDAIKKLMDLSPKTVSLVQEDGNILELASDKVLVGDVLLIRAGQQIPVDGVVIEGQSSLDVSSLTGEFMPVEVAKDSEIMSGSININGAFKMQVKSVGADTMLSKIIHLVQEAQGSKAPIARMADKVSLYFVPTVIALSLVMGFAWYFWGGVSFAEALKIFVAINVVACPCALGLATPMSIMVATGQAARHGLLIKNGTALEYAGMVQTIVFDKTGTLTQGRPQISLISCVQKAWSNSSKKGYEWGIIRRLVLGIEQNSDHPLAKAMLQYFESEDASVPKENEILSPSPKIADKKAIEDKIIGDKKEFGAQEKALNIKQENILSEKQDLDLNEMHAREVLPYPCFDVREESGRGMSASLYLRKDDDVLELSVYLGNKRLIQENSIFITEEESRIIEEISAQGKSPLILAQGLGKVVQSSEKRSEFVNKSTSEPMSELIGGAVDKAMGDFTDQAMGESTNKSTDDFSGERMDEFMGKSLIEEDFFLAEARILAIFSVEDPLRSESVNLVHSLQERGLRVMLLSGDNRQTVFNIAKQAGIKEEDCLAEVLPIDKEATIRQLQKDGTIVAMVGDGVNDAPALAKAHVGIVMGNGVDIAMDAGDIVLMKGVESILTALRLSHATINNIRLSLFWAFAYNVLLIPAAAGIFLLFGGPALSPMLAGAAMAFSSVSVVMNSLRLRGFK